MVKIKQPTTTPILLSLLSATLTILRQYLCEENLSVYEAKGSPHKY